MNAKREAEVTAKKEWERKVDATSAAREVTKSAIVLEEDLIQVPLDPAPDQVHTQEVEAETEIIIEIVAEETINDTVEEVELLATQDLQAETEEEAGAEAETNLAEVDQLILEEEVPQVLEIDPKTDHHQETIKDLKVLDTKIESVMHLLEKRTRDQSHQPKMVQLSSLQNHLRMAIKQELRRVLLQIIL